MTRDDIAGFRIGTWPNSLADLKDRVHVVRVYEEVELHDDVWLQYEGWAAHRDVPDELYLRELRSVDIRNPESIRGFVADWGRIERPVQPVGYYRDLPTWVDHAMPVRAIRRRLTGAVFGLGYAWSHRSFSHVGEVAVHIAALRHCVCLYSWLRGEADLDANSTAWEMPEVFPPPKSQAAAIETLKDLLDPPLMDFAPTVLGPERSHSGSDRRIVTGLYPGMALQFFNHIAENADYRICANEVCRKQFVRHRGRAQYGQFRTSGVTYCSWECAKAQTSRRYERAHPGRKRKHKGEN